MSHKKHKGNHGKRAEERARSLTADQRQPAAIRKPRRVFLRNGVYIALTILVILAVVAILAVFQFLGWWDTPIGSVLSVLIGAFGIMCVYDVGLLMTSCISFGEGLVSAGKNEDGQAMIFHAASVLRMELRDKSGNILPEDRKVYKNVDLVFLMESGRVNHRFLSRLTAKQYRKLQIALEAESRIHHT